MIPSEFETTELFGKNNLHKKKRLTSTPLSIEGRTQTYGKDPA